KSQWQWVDIINAVGIKNITKRLRGIHAACHFWFAVSFSGESGLRKVGLGGIHPLTRRYAFFRKEELWLLKSGEQSHLMLKR
ncbi:hypothetical protein ACSL9C_004086, partial [Vibrio navarrensis]